MLTRFVWLWSLWSLLASLCLQEILKCVHSSGHWVFSDHLLCFRLEYTQRYGSPSLRDGLGRKANDPTGTMQCDSCHAKEIRGCVATFRRTPVQPDGVVRENFMRAVVLSREMRLTLLQKRCCLYFIVFIWACLAFAVTFWRLIYLPLIKKKKKQLLYL